jgi:hypothetical protein
MWTIEVSSGASDAVAHIANDMLILHGFSTAETAGSASTAEVVLRHGTNDTSPMLCAPINFASDGFGYPTFFPVPMYCPNGIFVERRSGETTVILYCDYQ